MVGLSFSWLEYNDVKSKDMVSFWDDRRLITAAARDSYKSCDHFNAWGLLFKLHCLPVIAYKLVYDCYLARRTKNYCVERWAFNIRQCSLCRLVYRN